VFSVDLLLYLFANLLDTTHDPSDRWELFPYCGGVGGGLGGVKVDLIVVRDGLGGVKCGFSL
jgi:hypothetical protein